MDNTNQEPMQQEQDVQQEQDDQVQQQQQQEQVQQQQQEQHEQQEQQEEQDKKADDKDKDQQPADTEAQPAEPEPKENEIELKLRSEFNQYTAAEKHKDCYGTVSLTAPFHNPSDSDRGTLDMVVVIDKSGSMSGRKLDLVKKTMAFLIKNLSARDRMGIVLYDSDVSVLFNISKMDDAGKKNAEKKVASISAGSCTNLSGGLFKGIELMQSRREKNQVSSVLLMTDGLANEGISKTAPIVSAMRSMMGDKPSFSVYCFGYGADHDATMLKAISEGGNGMYYNIEEAAGADGTDVSVAEAFSDCLGGLLSVVAQNITVTLEMAQAHDLPDKNNKDDAKKEEDKEDKEDEEEKEDEDGAEDDQPQQQQEQQEQQPGMLGKMVRFAASAIGSMTSSSASSASAASSSSSSSSAAAAPTDTRPTVADVHTKYTKTVGATRTTAEITIGDLQSEETKDILIQFTLPAITATTAAAVPEHLVLTATVSYFNVILGTMCSTSSRLTVSRPATLSPDIRADQYVEQQRLRQDTVTAIDKANALAQRGDFARARTTIQAQVAAVKPFKDKYTMASELLDDLNACLSGVQSRQSYNDFGSREMSSCVQTHAYQRSNKAWHARGHVSYETSSRAFYKSSAKSFMKK